MPEVWHRICCLLVLRQMAGNRFSCKRPGEILMEMKKEVIVVDPNRKSSQELCALLAGRGYRPKPLHSLTDLKRYLNESSCLVVILDLNMPSVDNRVIRELTLKNPGVYFLGLTRHRFNPDLEESICYHVYACVTKPVDAEELFYWLKSISEDESDLK